MRLQTLTGVPAVQALAVSGVLWLLVFAYCDYALWRDPHGAFFHSEHIYDLGYSGVRQQEARAFLQQYSISNSTDCLTRCAAVRKKLPCNPANSAFASR